MSVLGMGPRVYTPDTAMSLRHNPSYLDCLSLYRNTPMPSFQSFFQSPWYTFPLAALFQSHPQPSPSEKVLSKVISNLAFNLILSGLSVLSTQHNTYMLKLGCRLYQKQIMCLWRIPLNSLSLTSFYNDLD